MLTSSRWRPGHGCLRGNMGSGTDPLAQAAASTVQVHSMSHSDTCDRPISFTDIVSHIYFLILIQSTIAHTLSLIFLCPLILFPSHVFSPILSLLECLSDTRTHSLCLGFCILVSPSSILLPLNSCPNHTFTLSPPQKHSPVRVSINSLETHSYHPLFPS